MGSFLDMFGDSSKKQQLESDIGAALQQSLTISPPKMGKTHRIRIHASDLVWWVTDENRISDFISRVSKFVSQDLATRSIATVGSVNVKIEPDNVALGHTIIVSLDY
jgi:hypothetical protein